MVKVKYIKESEQRATMMKLEEKIAKARATEKVLKRDGEEHIQLINQATFNDKTQENTTDKVNTTNTTNFHESASYSDSKEREAKTIISQMTQLVKLQAAPEDEIDVLSGDPLEYKYFITTFKNVVDNAIEDRRGRLN